MHAFIVCAYGLHTTVNFGATYKKTIFVFLPNYYLTGFILNGGYFIVIYLFSHKPETIQKMTCTKSEQAKTKQCKQENEESDETKKDEIESGDEDENYE